MMCLAFAFAVDAVVIVVVVVRSLVCLIVFFELDGNKKLKQTEKICYSPKFKNEIIALVILFPLSGEKMEKKYYLIR